MPLYYIEHECNGQTERSSEGVDLTDFAEAGGYALSAAPLHDLLPGERRECTCEVRDADGWRLKMVLRCAWTRQKPATSKSTIIFRESAANTT